MASVEKQIKLHTNTETHTHIYTHTDRGRHTLLYEDKNKLNEKYMKNKLC